MKTIEQAKETTAVDLGALMDDGDDPVVMLVAGATRLVAHRAVLMDRSPVFAAMFRHDTLQSRSWQVTIVDVEGPVLRQLLSFLYTLRAPQLPDIDTVTQLLAAADTYGVAGLKAACEQQVAAQLSVETAATAAVLAVRHSCDSLRQAIITFLKANLVHMLGTQAWADTVLSQPRHPVEECRLVADPLPESSAPAPARSGTPASAAPAPARSGTPASAAPAPAHSGTPASAAPAPAHSGTPASAAPAPAHSGTPASAAPAPAHSGTPASAAPAPAHSGTPASAAPAPAHSGTPASAAPAPAHSGTPASAAPAPAHSGTPASAAPATPPPDDAVVSLLRSLPAEEKNKRLREAAEEGAVGELEALLAAGANVVPECGYKTPLHHAAIKGHVEAVRRLVAWGAPVGATDEFHQTPLHLAAGCGHAAVVRLLLATSADHSARTIAGWEPLHLAAYSGHAEAAAALLEAGAPKGARSNRGVTALDLARLENHHHLVELLAEG